MDYFKVFVLTIWKQGVSIYELGKVVETKLGFGCVNFEILLDVQVVTVTLTLKMTFLSPCLRLENINGMIRLRPAFKNCLNFNKPQFPHLQNGFNGHFIGYEDGNRYL